MCVRILRLKLCIKPLESNKLSSVPPPQTATNVPPTLSVSSAYPATQIPTQIPTATGLPSVYSFQSSPSNISNNTASPMSDQFVASPCSNASDRRPSSASTNHSMDSANLQSAQSSQCLIPQTQNFGFEPTHVPLSRQPSG